MFDYVEVLLELQKHPDKPITAGIGGHTQKVFQALPAIQGTEFQCIVAPEGTTRSKALFCEI